MTKDILQCLSNNDAEGLKSLFANAVQELETLDSEIEVALTFFNGRVKSYRSGGIGGIQKITNEVQHWSFYLTIRNIITDSGDKYRLTYGYDIVNEFHPDVTGLVHIKIVSESGKGGEVSIGQVFHSGTVR